MRKAARAIIIYNNQLLVMHRNKFGKEYYTLIGGNVEMGETTEQALVREVRDETSLKIASYRHVCTEEAGSIYGNQYIYLCEYPGGDIELSPESDEAHINKLGKNLYTPMWLPLDKLADVPFVSERLKQFILEGLRHGFPDSPRQLNKTTIY